MAKYSDYKRSDDHASSRYWEILDAASSFVFLSPIQHKLWGTLAHDVDLLICESMYDDAADLLARANASLATAEEAAIMPVTAGAHALVLDPFSPKINNTSQKNGTLCLLQTPELLQICMVISLAFSDTVAWSSEKLNHLNLKQLDSIPYL